jgi:hypothetical protein
MLAAMARDLAKTVSRRANLRAIPSFGTADRSMWLLLLEALLALGVLLLIVWWTWPKKK